MKQFLLFLFIGISTVLQAQIKDSLVLINGDVLVGELKSMDNAVAVIETDYSDKDFTIEWEGIVGIYTVRNFVIGMADGTRPYGTFRSVDSTTILITLEEGGTVKAKLNDVIFLDALDKGFWSRFYANIDIGFSLTKANNFKQLDTRLKAGYTAQKWNLEGTYNLLFSIQDSVEDIRRTDGGISFKFFLPHDFFLLASVDFLSSSELNLNLRTTGQLGAGYYFFHTNHLNWAASLGGALNSEDFSGDTPDRFSFEGFVGTELNIMDISEIDFTVRAVAFPSFTEAGRWRSDLGIDFFYDLPLDFYLKLGFDLNYDNRPAEGATETDYVLQTGFGWKW